MGWESSTLSEFGFQYCSRGAGGAVVGRVIDVSTARGMPGEQYSFCIWVSVLLTGCWRSSTLSDFGNHYCSWSAGGAVVDRVIDVSTAPARLYLLLALPLVLLLILLLDPVSHEKALPHFNEMRQPALVSPFSTYLYTGIFLDYFPVFNYYCVQYFSFRYRCSGEYNSHNIQDFLYSLELNQFPREGCL